MVEAEAGLECPDTGRVEAPLDVATITAGLFRAYEDGLEAYEDGLEAYEDGLEAAGRSVLAA